MYMSNNWLDTTASPYTNYASNTYKQVDIKQYSMRLVLER